MTILRDDVLVRSPATASPELARMAAPEPARQSRIDLRRPAGEGTFVDGGWWPHSLDLVVELPPLLAAIEAAGYAEVRRVSYALTAWDGRPPRKTTMLNRTVKLGGFGFQDAAEIGLVDSSGWKRVTITVIPPDAEPDVARRALAMAGMNSDRHSAREILELAGKQAPAHSSSSGCVDWLAASDWESEGGRAAR